MHFLAAIFTISGVAVMLAIFFAPDRPPPPAPSKTTYEPRPEHRHGELPPVPPPRGRGRARPQAQLAVDEPTLEDGEGCLVQGVVRDAKTKQPLKDASINARRKTEFSTEFDRDYVASSHARTVEGGKYAMRLLTPGRYYFIVRREGYLLTSIDEIELSEDDETHTLDFELRLGATISGRITETGTGKPVPDMEVYAGAQRTGGHARSGEDGRYTVSGLTPDAYEVTANLPSRGGRNSMFSFAEFQFSSDGPRAVSSLRREVRITRDDEEIRGIDFTVEPFGAVWGYILTYEDEAVRNAEIALCTSTTLVRQLLDMAVKQRAPITASTAHNGYYEMVGVPLNKEWRLFTLPRGHAPQLSDPFLLTPSQRVARIDIFVSPGSDVYGVVVGPDRKPIADAEVFCLPSTSSLLGPFTTAQTFDTARSNEDGSFKFNNLPAGDYQVYGSKPGYRFTTQGEPFHSDGRRDVIGLSVLLTPVEQGTLTVYGAVTDTQGTPLSGVQLSLGGFGAETIDDGEKTTTTDGEGNYAFYNINPGFYLLAAGGPGYDYKVVSNVKFDEPTDIVLERATLISGHVRVRETGNPPNYFTVRVLGGTGSGPLSLTQSLAGRSFSTPDGYFELHARPGDYTLEARASGYAPGRTDVTVREGRSVTGVVIEISESGGSISGRVVIADGRGAGGALVSLGETGDMPMPSFLSAMQGSIQVGPDGEFEFLRLAAGTYTVTARLDGYAPAIFGPVTLGQRQSSSGHILRLTRGNRLQGYVAFNGRMEPGAIVTIVGNGMSEIANADANGYYQFDNLPAGSYVGSAVSINALSGGSFSPLHARIEILDGQNNEHNFGEPTHTALAALCTPPPAFGTMGFALLLWPGAPADIVALNLTNPAAWFQDSSELATYVAGMAQIGRDGYFRIDNLIQGEYRLDIIYTSLGEIMSGSVSLVHSGQVSIEQGRLNELDLNVGS